MDYWPTLLNFDFILTNTLATPLFPNKAHSVTLEVWSSTYLFFGGGDTIWPIAITMTTWLFTLWPLTPPKLSFCPSAPHPLYEGYTGLHCCSVNLQKMFPHQGFCTCDFFCLEYPSLEIVMCLISSLYSDLSSDMIFWECLLWPTILPHCISNIWKHHSFFFLASPCGLQDLSSQKRNQNHAPCSGSTASEPQDCQGIPCISFISHHSTSRCLIFVFI